MHFYTVCGLSVASELALPGAIASSPLDVPDVTIRGQPVPAALDGAEHVAPTWQMAGPECREQETQRRPVALRLKECQPREPARQLEAASRL